MKQVLAHQRDKKEIALQPTSPSTFMEEINELIRNLEKRAYELFEGRGREDGRDWDDWFEAEKELFKPLPLEIKEQENGLVIRAEVPGFKADELEISLEPALLTIRGIQKHETEKKEKKKLYSETREKEVFRRVTLPVNVLPDDAKATLNDGVLEIAAPKDSGAKEIHMVAA